MTKIAMFCGGSGAASIIKALIERTDVELSLLINGYDNGKSTGEYRKLFKGMLGPADFRKNIGLTSSLPNLFEYLEDRNFEETSNWASTMDHRIDTLSCTYFSNAPPLEDSPVGNRIFVGCYLMHGMDFNLTVKILSRLLFCKANICNITGNENRWLIAETEDGQLLNEEEISFQTGYGEIMRTELVGDDLNDGPSWPKLSWEARAALEHADIVVAGPGTYYSSIQPSFKTLGLAEVLKSKPYKTVWIGNLESQWDSRTLSHYAMMDRVNGLLGFRFFTRLFTNQTDQGSRLINYNIVANKNGKHDGKQITDLLCAL